MSILEILQKKYPELVKSMKESSHHLDENNLNPYHLEGDVWTHTMLVYNYAKLNNFPIEVQIASLLHDIGKPKARFIKDETKVAFFNHENISTVLAIKILNDLKKDYNFNYDIILQLINHHSDFHSIGKFDEDDNFLLSKKDEMKLNKKYGHDYFYYKCMVQMNMSDNYGRFTETVSEKQMKNKFFVLNNFIPYDYFKIDKTNFPIAIMLSGLPSSGKSTFLKKLDKNFIIFSSDDLIMKKYPKLTYSQAFDKIVEKDEFKWIEKELRENLSKAIKERKNIVFDRTNLTKKIRNRWFNMVPTKYYNKKSVFIISDFDKIIERNKKRKGKVISDKIYDFMIKNFKLTGYDEEFDSIEIFNNSRNLRLLQLKEIERKKNEKIIKFNKNTPNKVKVKDELLLKL